MYIYIYIDLSKMLLFIVNMSQNSRYLKQYILSFCNILFCQSIPPQYRRNM